MDKPNVLLIEDNADHAELIKRIIASSIHGTTIIHLSDGEQAVDYLFRRGAYQQLIYDNPKLILLDLRMPKIDGHEVLRTIKSNPTLCEIPVVILSSSHAHSDISKAYQLHANSYLVKPGDFDTFKKLINDLSYYWFYQNQTV